MDASEQNRRADVFRALHRAPPILLLPNAWDAMSAAIFEAAGHKAIATTSAGVAWALGFADGEQAPWPEVVAATKRIVDAVSVPVTADIETGYGAGPVEVAKSIAEIARAGAVGVNLEDGAAAMPNHLRPLEDAAARVRAARDAASQAGVKLVINARVDTYLHPSGSAAERFAETVRRAKAYLAAGADCIYPITLSDLGTIADLTRAIGAPVNIMGRSGVPSLAELERAGVARVTIASGATLAIMGEIKRIATSLRQSGDFGALGRGMGRPEAQQLFAKRGGARS